jgi:hypothetical protein
LSGAETRHCRTPKPLAAVGPCRLRIQYFAVICLDRRPRQSAAHCRNVLSFQPDSTAASLAWGFGRARVALKAARFRAFALLRLVQLRAASRCPFGAAFDRAASPRGRSNPTKPQRCRFSFKTKGQTMSNSANRPTHRVYAVTKNGKKSYWRAIGAAWPHSDGEGFNLKLDYLPLNGAEIKIRRPKADDADAAPDGETA